MEQSFLLRHRLKLFIAVLLLGFVLLWTFAKTKMQMVALSNMEGVGYAQLTNTFSKMGAIVDAETEPGSVDRAQGYRYALRQIGQWESLFFGDFNAQTPTISRCPSRPCKYGFDNPDTTYLLIGPLSNQNSYIIRGQKGSVAYTTYQVFSIGRGDGFGGSSTLEDSRISFDQDGSFELFLSKSNPDNYPNFMALPDGFGAQLIVRQLSRDWNRETENAFAIDVQSSNPDEPAPPKPLSLQAFDRRAMGLNRFLNQQFTQWRDRISNAPVNAIEHGKADRADGGFPTNFTSYMRYEIGKGEGLLMEIEKVDVVYANIQLASRWAESLVYPSRTASFNDFQAYLDADGVYRYVIATEDPGVPNWLDATGFPSGGVFMRWQTPEGDMPKPKTKLIKLSELREHLPAGHPEFTSAQRAEQLRKRHSGFLRRQSPVYFK